MANILFPWSSLFDVTITALGFPSGSVGKESTCNAGAENLLESIDYYRNYQNSTGNDYSSHANELMNEALDFQNVRNNLVRENPNLFK